MVGMTCSLRVVARGRMHSYVLPMVAVVVWLLAGPLSITGSTQASAASIARCGSVAVGVSGVARDEASGIRGSRVGCATARAVARAFLKRAAASRGSVSAKPFAKGRARGFRCASADAKPRRYSCRRGRPTRALVRFIYVRTPGAGGRNPNLGTNLGGLTYYDGVVPFNDLVQQAGDWVPQQQGRGWGEGDPIELRTDGWPARLGPGQSGVLPLAVERYPAGRYSVSWKGSGSFEVAGKAFSGADGSGTVDLDGSSLSYLEVLATNPSDPLRRVRVLAPGSDASELFRPVYLRSLAPYRILRFMDWQRTNGTFADPVPAQTCASRVRPTSVSQGQRPGASAEVMVALANQLDADPWFTIPHTAEESWIRCHAQVVARDLDRGLTPRYEFSNETWNPGFIQFHDLSADAQAHGLGGGDTFLGLQQEVALRHADAMDVLGQVFSRAGRPFTRVLSGQAANDFVLEERLAFGGAAARTDEIAVAPYVGIPDANPYDPSEASDLASLGRAATFGLMREALETEVGPWIRAHVALAGRSGKSLVAYEGGQHLAGDPGNGALTALFVGANRDERMGALYDDYLGLWRSLTANAPFVHFTDSGPYTRFGSWGATEAPDLSTSASPKYRALLRYSAR